MLIDLQVAGILRLSANARIALLAAALVFAVSGCTRHADLDRCIGCNVLLISLDTLRADHVGAYGYTRATTPTIDGLAARGVLFEQAISQSSWTRPAHWSMFTGLYPSEHGIVALRHRTRLNTAVPRLADVLREHGYVTAAFTGGINIDSVFGFDQGFDTYRANGMRFRDNLEELRMWLDEHSRDRFFLFLHSYDPHTPYASDPIDRKALGLGKPPPSATFRKICETREPYPRTDAAIDPFVDEYDAGIHRGDRFLGKILSRMTELGMLDNTVIVFTSDHGEEFFDHGGCHHIETLYREVLHVPLLVVAPGLKPTRIADLVPASVSIGPTIVDLLGIKDAPLPGPSLVPYLAGERPQSQPVVSETYMRAHGNRGQGHLISLTTANEKLIRNETLDNYEYFNLETDLAEQRPLDAAASAWALEQQLEQWRDTHPLLSEAERVEKIPPKLLEQLKSLGYVQ